MGNAGRVLHSGLWAALAAPAWAPLWCWGVALQSDSRARMCCAGFCYESS